MARVNRITAASDTSRERVQACIPRISADAPDLDAWAQKYLRSHVERIAVDLDLLARHAKPGALVVEFGSAPYLFTLAARDAGYRIRGIDVDPARFAGFIERENLDVLHANFETEVLPLAEGSADVIVLNEVFEHLRIDLIGTMEEVYRILAPGGVCLISTPNLKSLRGIRRFLFEGKAFGLADNIYDEYAKLRKIGHMGHVREYTRVEVTEFLERLGFAVDDVIYRGRIGQKWPRRIARLFPALLPFFTVVARKPSA